MSELRKSTTSINRVENEQRNIGVLLDSQAVLNVPSSEKWSTLVELFQIFKDTARSFGLSVSNSSSVVSHEAILPIQNIVVRQRATQLDNNRMALTREWLCDSKHASGLTKQPHNESIHGIALEFSRQYDGALLDHGKSFDSAATKHNFSCLKHLECLSLNDSTTVQIKTFQTGQKRQLPAAHASWPIFTSSVEHEEDSDEYTEPISLEEKLESHDLSTFLRVKSFNRRHSSPLQARAHKRRHMAPTI